MSIEQRPRPITHHLLLAAAWLIILVLGFRWGVDRLLLSTDGRYYLTIATSRAGSDWPWFSDNIDFLHGIGDQLFPFRPEIIPAFRILSWLGFSESAKVGAFVWLALELAGSVIFLARSMRCSYATAIGAGATCVVCLLPLWNFGAVYTFVHIAPQFCTGVAVTNAASGFYLRIGRGRSIADVLWLLGIAAALVWFVLASPLAIMLPAPLLGMTALVGLFAAADASERWRKIAAIVILGVLLLCGPAEYVVAEVMSSAAFVFNVELENSLASWPFASIIFHLRDISPMGPLLVASAVGGAILHWSSPNRTLRFFGYGILTYLFTRLTFAWLTITFDFWRGPAPIYFELFVVPVYCIFAWLLWQRAIEWIATRWPRWKQLPAWFSAYGSVASRGIAVLTGNLRHVRDPYIFPPPATVITSYLAEHARLAPGGVFGGRVATMTGLNLGKSVSWFDLVGKVDPVLLRYTGNDPRQSGLRYFGVPVLFEYSPMVTAPFYALTTRLLGYPQDEQVRNAQVLRRVAPRVLAMLGVRYVIADAVNADPDLQLRVTLPLGNEGALQLYEVSNANLGNYSPVDISVLADATATLDRIGSTAFDPAREVVLDADPNSGPLVAATNAALRYEGASLHITADSAGRSLLLLPLQYSHCLEASAGGAQLLRADLVETAVLFENHLDTRIALRTGPFLHPLCRLQDVADDKRLQMRSVPRDLQSGK